MAKARTTLLTIKQKCGQSVKIHNANKCAKKN